MGRGKQGGGEQGDLNFSFPLPFNPSSHPILLTPASITFLIVKYCTMLHNFQLPTKLEISLPASSTPTSHPLFLLDPPPCPLQKQHNDPILRLVLKGSGNGFFLPITEIVKQNENKCKLLSTLDDKKH